MLYAMWTPLKYSNVSETVQDWDMIIAMVYIGPKLSITITLDDFQSLLKVTSMI